VEVQGQMPDPTQHIEARARRHVGSSNSIPTLIGGLGASSSGDLEVVPTLAIGDIAGRAGTERAPRGESDIRSELILTIQNLLRLFVDEFASSEQRRLDNLVGRFKGLRAVSGNQDVPVDLEADFRREIEKSEPGMFV